jgi:hypothetical protein
MSSADVTQLKSPPAITNSLGSTGDAAKAERKARRIAGFAGTYMATSAVERPSQSQVSRVNRPSGMPASSQRNPRMRDVTLRRTAMPVPPV